MTNYHFISSNLLISFSIRISAPLNTFYSDLKPVDLSSTQEFSVIWWRRFPTGFSSRGHRPGRRITHYIDIYSWKRISWPVS